MTRTRDGPGRRGHKGAAGDTGQVRVRSGRNRIPAPAALGKHEQMAARSVATTAVQVPRGLVAAAVLGVIHAGFSLYWAAGGTLLVWSLGSGLVESFRGREWMLAPIGAVKLVAALSPVVLARSGWPHPRVTRLMCWLGALVLIVWGGLNTVVGNLVLAGVIESGSGFDRLGMVGHAFMWDPLFLAWGAALALGLLASRGVTSRRSHPGDRPERLGPVADVQGRATDATDGFGLR